METQEQPNWLTREEVAQLLRVTPEQISKAYVQGQLKGVKLGGVYRFHMDDVDAMRTTRPVRRGGR